MDDEFAPKPRGPRRKKPEDRLRRMVHTLLTDADYLQLLEKSTGQDVSAYVRDLIKKDLEKGSDQ